MNIKEKCQAAEALIQWFRSQEIDPRDSVPIMAIAINVACVSLIKDETSSKQTQLKDTVERSKAAARLVLEVMQDMLEGKIKPGD